MTTPRAFRLSATHRATVSTLARMVSRSFSDIPEIRFPICGSTPAAPMKLRTAAARSTAPSAVPPIPRAASMLAWARAFFISAISAARFASRFSAAISSACRSSTRRFAASSSFPLSSSPRRYAFPVSSSIRFRQASFAACIWAAT